MMAEGKGVNQAAGVMEQWSDGVMLAGRTGPRGGLESVGPDEGHQLLRPPMSVGAPLLGLLRKSPGS